MCMPGWGGAFESSCCGEAGPGVRTPGSELLAAWSCRVTFLTNVMSFPVYTCLIYLSGVLRGLKERHLGK